jgi:hypothetical protein
MRRKENWENESGGRKGWRSKRRTKEEMMEGKMWNYNNEEEEKT